MVVLVESLAPAALLDEPLQDAIPASIISDAPAARIIFFILVEKGLFR